MGAVFEAGHAGEHVDPIPRKLRLGHIDLGLDHVLDAEGKIRHRDLFLHAIVHAVDGTVVIAGEMQNGFAHRLAGNGAGIYRDPTDGSHFLHHSCPLAQLVGVDSGALPGRAGTNDEEIVGNHALLEGYRKYEWERLISHFSELDQNLPAKDLTVKCMTFF